MQDGSDAVSDWPLLNALLNTASGATWVSIHHGGGVGMGYSQHAGVVIVCDGSEAAGKRIRARAVERPRHRRHAPRRCRLRDRHRLRPRAGPEFADDRVTLEQIPGISRGPAGPADAAADLRETRRSALVGAGSQPHRRVCLVGGQDHRQAAMRRTASIPDSACWRRPAYRRNSSNSCSAICCSRTPREWAMRCRMPWCV